MLNNSTFLACYLDPIGLSVMSIAYIMVIDRRRRKQSYRFLSESKKSSTSTILIFI
jgi:hypothetical protein